MTAKEYLRQIRRIDQHIDSLIREREDLEKAQTFLRSPQIEGDRVQTSPSGDPPFMGYLLKWDKLTQQIGEEWDKLIELKHEAISRINNLKDSRHIDLLMRRYVRYESFEQIAVDMGYSFDYVLKIHGRALERFAEIMGRGV